MSDIIEDIRSLGTGATHTQTVLRLPNKGILRAAGVNATTANTPPLAVNLLLRLGGGDFILIASEWMRAGGVSILDGAVTWEGELDYDEGIAPTIRTNIRNDTGATVEYRVWAYVQTGSGSHEGSHEEPPETAP